MALAETSHQPAVLAAIAVRLVPAAAAVLAFVLLFVLFDSSERTPAFIALLLVLVGLWLVHQGLKDKTDHRALETAARSHRAKQGQWTAVCGKAIALEPEAEVPFPDVLAYRYQVFDEVSSVRTSQGLGKRRYRDLRYEGFYLVPTGIETDAGIVRLGGFPDLIHTEKSALPQGVLSRAEEKAQLKPRVLPSLVARAIMLAHTRDRIDVDIKYREEELAASGTCKSWVLRPGDQVCVFGKWEDGELLPAASRARGLPVYAGTAKDVFERLKDDSTAFMALGAVALAVAAGVALWFLF